MTDCSCSGQERGDGDECWYRACVERESASYMGPLHHDLWLNGPEPAEVVVRFRPFQAERCYKQIRVQEEEDLVGTVVRSVVEVKNWSKRLVWQIG